VARPIVMHAAAERRTRRAIRKKREEGLSKRPYIRGQCKRRGGGQLSRSIDVLGRLGEEGLEGKIRSDEMGMKAHERTR